MQLLIGSRAAKVWFPDFPREPKDFDFAVGQEYGDPFFKTENGMRYEYYPIQPLLDANRFSSMSLISADQLYTLKVSHLFWDKHWAKTMFDVWWLQKKGCQLIRPLFDELYKHWEKVHGPMPRADLNATVEDFFDNGIKNGHDHDHLHELLVGGPPTYTKILIDPNGVAIDEDKFWKLDYEDKLNIVREEVCVMAYERGARQGTKDYRTAYSDQLKAWILHHGPSLEMALFAVRNFDVLRKPHYNYKQILDEKLQRDHS